MLNLQVHYGWIVCIDPSMFLGKTSSLRLKEFLSVCAHNYELIIFVLLSSRSVDSYYKLTCVGHGCSSQKKVVIIIFFLHNVGNLNITTFDSLIRISFGHLVHPAVPEKSHCEFGVTGNVHPEAAVRVVQSMARFMASYFTSQLLCILPPHNVNVLPPLHIKTGKQIIFSPCFCT